MEGKARRNSRQCADCKARQWAGLSRERAVAGTGRSVTGHVCVCVCMKNSLQGVTKDFNKSPHPSLTVNTFLQIDLCVA